mmetsp:Transcript_3623/g.7989  ORF Transcript_3623/g.7989 Transcript_3623/m.7989 type:complete len:258 (+) Transcript_3623:70-843(+)
MSLTKRNTFPYQQHCFKYIEDSSNAKSIMRLEQHKPVCPATIMPKPKKRSRKTVQFSQTVNLRKVILTQQCDADEATAATSALWLTDAEVEASRRRAKILSKLHCQRMLRQEEEKDGLEEGSNSSTLESIANATHYTIKGESLRGLEIYTDRQRAKRRKLRDDVIVSVLIWQEEQFDRYLNTHFNYLQEEEDCKDEETDDNEIVARITAMVVRDSSQLARLYRAKARGALANAKRVAEEDAKVAMQILEEDLLDHEL